MSHHFMEIGYNDIKEKTEIIFFIQFLSEPIVGIFNEEIK